MSMAYRSNLQDILKSATPVERSRQHQIMCDPVLERLHCDVDTVRAIRYEYIDATSRHRPNQKPSKSDDTDTLQKLEDETTFRST